MAASGSQCGAPNEQRPGTRRHKISVGALGDIAQTGQKIISSGRSLQPIVSRVSRGSPDRPYVSDTCVRPQFFSFFPTTTTTTPQSSTSIQRRSSAPSVTHHAHRRRRCQRVSKKERRSNEPQPAQHLITAVVRSTFYSQSSLSLSLPSAVTVTALCGRISLI